MKLHWPPVTKEGVEKIRNLAEIAALILAGGWFLFRCEATSRLNISADVAAAEEMINTALTTPAILALLKPVGYPDRELEAGLELHGTAQTAFSGRQTSLGAKSDTKNARDGGEKSARAKFSDYRATVQANFKSAADRKTLGASGKVPGSLGTFITQARAAYRAAQ